MRSGIVIVLVIAGVVTGYLLLQPAAEVQREVQPSRAAPAAQAPAPAASALPAPAPAAGVADSAERAPMTRPPVDTRPIPPGLPATTSVFRTDAAGQLVLDEQTRLDVEALFASTERQDLAQMKQQHTVGLPAAAAAQALDLLERFENYQQAQRQTYPPGVEPTSEETALAELDGLHNLRVAYFGADLARALYGSEEQLSRSLLQLMELEKDPSLTLEEKAVRAQQLRDSLPEFRERQGEE